MEKKIFGVASVQECYLADANAIDKSFVAAELNTINQVFKEYTGQTLFNSSDPKNKKVNIISSKFGDQFIIHPKVAKTRTCKSLKDIAFKFCCTKQVLAVSFTLKLQSWEASASVNLVTNINHRNEQFKYFSFLEYPHKHQQLEPRTLDPTHILTNL